MVRDGGRPAVTDGQMQRLLRLVGGHPAATYRAVARRLELVLTPALAKKWPVGGGGKAPKGSSGVELFTCDLRVIYQLRHGGPDGTWTGLTGVDGQA